MLLLLLLLLRLQDGLEIRHAGALAHRALEVMMAACRNRVVVVIIIIIIDIVCVVVVAGWISEIKMNVNCCITIA